MICQVLLDISSERVFPTPIIRHDDGDEEHIRLR